MSRGKAKTIFSGITWTIIQNAVNILYGLVAVPFLIGYYGKEEYGLIGLALSINAYVTLLDLGMTNSNVRFFSEFLAKGDKEKTQRLFNLTHLFYLVLGILNSIILVVLSFFVESFFKITPSQVVTLRNLILILALNATFSWISVCFDQFLRANELIDWIKRRATFLKIMLFGVLSCAIIFHWPIEWYFTGYIFMGTIILPLTVIKARRVMPELRFGLHLDFDMLRTILPYALSIFSFGIFHFLVTSSRPIVLGNMIGPGAVAEFNIMATITSVVSIFTSSLMQVLLPILTKMKVLSDESGVQKIMMSGTKYISVFLAVMIFAMVISVPELITLYVGEEFVMLTPWLILWLITLLLSHRNVMTSLVFTEKRLASVSIMAAVAMVVAIVSYIFLTPYLGVGGVVVGFAVHELIHTLFYYIFFFPRRFGIHTKQIFLRSVAPSLLLLGGIALIVFFVFRDIVSPWSSLLWKSLVFGLLSMVVVWFIILDKNDKQLLRLLTRINK